MCGIAGVFGAGANLGELEAMVAAQGHRGPDANAVHAETDDSGELVGLGHNRLSIIDLSDAGLQPMSDPDGRVWIAFNGEIYNYRELRAELQDFPFRTNTDTEVIIAAYLRWGEACLDRFVGMFSFLLWDKREKRLLAVRDRFGKKPLYYRCRPGGGLMIASEIRSLHAGGAPAEPDPATWATYLAHGLLEHSSRTFWQDIVSLPAGHLLRWKDGDTEIERWYDLAQRVGTELDDRSADEVQVELLDLLTDSVGRRLHADVPVGINLSGGLDSSILLGLVHRAQGPDSSVTAFTFATGDERYDELPWAREMLKRTNHPWEVCVLEPDEVPELAASVHAHQSEPFGGLPTLAYAKLFERARELGILVLLDGQGMDEQWAGYDYYASVPEGRSAGYLQGAVSAPARADCLTDELRSVAEPFRTPAPFAEPLRNVQYRDTCFTKIPRAVRFNDRISMRSSTELRSPFLDHRLFELAFRQREALKLHGDTHKWLPRQVAGTIAPERVAAAAKRPVQTPQREWLRGPLQTWAGGRIEAALDVYGGTWLRSDAVRTEWRDYCAGGGDNSYFVWQWVSLGLTVESLARPRAATAAG
ncbi:MAG: asparagine synthase (glutamine-hydrolyzing) [Solirubrobacteraceae bacterium]